LPSCGSLILCDDLYGSISKQDNVRFLALDAGRGKKWSKIRDVHLLKIRKETDGRKFKKYIAKLSNEINKHVIDFKPDIIHIQHFSFGMAMAFSKLKLPKIAICHGTGILFASDSEFHQKNVAKALTSSRRVIFPTKNICNDFKNAFPSLKSIKTEIIPWGIPDGLCLSARPKNEWSKKTCNILYAGRLTRNKGVDTIIKSLRLLDTRVKLTIIGSGDQLESLTRLVEHYNLSNRVRFISFQTRKKLWGYFEKFDALIISTKKVEAFCLVAIEAQAHGLPVIYSDTGGTKEVIGNSGLVFKAGDYHDLAQKIESLMFNSDLLDKYSKLGIQNVRKYKISKMRKLLFNTSKKV